MPADSKPTLDTFTKNIGFTPNMMATFAQSPVAFNSWAALLGSLSKALDVKTRDSIGLAVSEVNGCNYCLTVHSFTTRCLIAVYLRPLVLQGQISCRSHLDERGNFQEESDIEAGIRKPF